MPGRPTKSKARAPHRLTRAVSPGSVRPQHRAGGPRPNHHTYRRMTIMTESTNWTSTDPEPVTTGTVTKSVRPTPDPLKEGVAALQAAAEAARRRPEAEIDKVRYSLQPVIKE